MTYVLIETPIETLFEIAEKIKLKLPIEKNDLYEENKPKSLFNKLGCFFKPSFMPKNIEMKKSHRNFFTAAYQSNLHDK